MTQERTAPPLLQVEGLRVRFPAPAGSIEAVRGIAFVLGREKLGLVGESGSGKSSTGRALMGLVPWPGRVTAERLEFDGSDLLSLSARERRALRGRRMAMILQDPKFSPNPVMTVGAQIAETWRMHAGAPRAEAKARALHLLAGVGIEDPERIYDSYPHEISGGQGQRAMIAAMVIAEPELLIADEPTSALDATARAQVLDVLDRLARLRGMGLILISHDLDLVSSFCDRVLVMRRGEIVESLAAARIDSARHPYTRRLLAARLRLDASGATETPR